jgi:chromosome segregation ATPase
MKQLAQAESELRSVAEREKSAIQVSEDLAKQLEEARRKAKTLESEVSAARAEIESARAEAAAAVAAAASTGAGGAMMGEAGASDAGDAIATEPGEELIAPLDVDTAQA